MEGRENFILVTDCCRTCLTYKNVVLSSIQETERENLKLADILEMYLSINPEQNDKLPQKMCEKCIERMYFIHKFLEKCKAVEAYLQYAAELNKQNPGAICVKIEGNDNKGGDSKKTERIKDPKSSILMQLLSCRDERNQFRTYKNNNKKTECKEDIGSKEEQEIINHTKDIVEAKTSHEKSCTGSKLQNKILEVLRSDHNYCAAAVEESIPDKNTIDHAITRSRISRYDPPRCTECLDSFENFRSLRIHWQTYNHYPKRLRCSYCNRGFTTMTVLKRHVNIHTSESIYQCATCDKVFNHRSNFKTHLSRHDNVRRYKCKECDERFTQSEFLKNHERERHGREKLLCLYCGKAFTNFQAFQVHEKNHNKNEGKTVSRERSSFKEFPKLQTNRCYVPYVEDRYLLKWHQKNTKRNFSEIEPKQGR